MTGTSAGLSFDRRSVLAAMAAGGSLLLGPRGETTAADPSTNKAVTPLKRRRELFVDNSLIEQITGSAQLRLQHPLPREVVLRHDAPWEGSGSGYHSVFQDGPLYRMYYKAWHLQASGGKLKTDTHPLYCCYAESRDGIRWRKPELKLVSFQGSTKNNIAIASGRRGPLVVDAGHPAVFKDDNPQAGSDAGYKAILRSAGARGLLPFKSPDGIHWSPMTDKPILGGLGAFDSQNLAFWDPNIGKYRAYWRIFTGGTITDKVWKPTGYRAIRTATSADLVHWDKHHDLTYVDSPDEQLYTNQIKPYHRAPHMLIGFPTRYVDRGWSKSMRDLPELEHRKQRAAANRRYGTALTEALFMASRNGTQFTRYNEAFLRPGMQRPGSWHYGHQYIAWHVVETASSLPGAGNELSLYASESYWTGKGSALRRYTLRLDGFVSVHASASGGRLLTRPITFSGQQLRINAATSAAGGIRAELQSLDGQPIPGHALKDCNEFFGDTTDAGISWKGGGSLAKIAGRPLRLLFQMKDADLYSYRFAERSA